jgi:hypothetical protein
MMAITNFLIRLKPWQLFLLFIVPYFFSSVTYLSIVTMPIWISAYIGWIYSIGVTMHALIPNKNKPNVTYFKYCCALLACTLIAIMVFSGLLGETNFMMKYPIDLFIIFPIYIFLCFSVWMFAARMLESMIEGEMVNRSDALKAFFMFWMFPIGVWYIQPAVKRVLDKYNNDKIQ